MNIVICQKEEPRGRCCCNCCWHLADYYHCTTAPQLKSALHTWMKEDEEETTAICICGLQKGWICAAPEDRAYSGWTEHGLCEMWEMKDEGFGLTGD